MNNNGGPPPITHQPGAQLPRTSGSGSGAPTDTDPNQQHQLQLQHPQQQPLQQQQPQQQQPQQQQPQQQQGVVPGAPVNPNAPQVDPNGYPPPGYPPQGYPPPGAYPPQGYPPPGAYPPQGYPPPGAYPPQGYPPPGAYPPQYTQGAGQPQYCPPDGQPPPPPGHKEKEAKIKWMPAPMVAIPDCPPGLEYLSLIDKLFVKQKISMFEMMTGWEVANQYSILNAAGQRIYYAYEESTSCQLQCNGGGREFTMHIVDNLEREVIRVKRPFKCCTFYICGNSNSCGEECTIEAPPGVPVGMVRTRGGCCQHNYVVKDARDETDILTIEGPQRCTFQYSCNGYGDKVFKIRTVDPGNRIGSVRKKWTNYYQEMYTNADLFGVEFPLDLDFRLKATLIGATFLIDFMAFEEKHNNNHSSSSSNY